MEELEKVIQNESLNIPEKNREEWIKTALTWAKLCLKRGDSIEKISNRLKR